MSKTFNSSYFSLKELMEETCQFALANEGRKVNAVVCSRGAGRDGAGRKIVKNAIIIGYTKSEILIYTGKEMLCWTNELQHINDYVYFIKMGTRKDWLNLFKDIYHTDWCELTDEIEIKELIKTLEL
jgi:hypothetical protein